MKLAHARASNGPVQVEDARSSFPSVEVHKLWVRASSKKARRHRHRARKFSGMDQILVLV